MQAYPYRLTGDSVKAKVGATIQAVLDVWAQEWFAVPPAFSIRVNDTLPMGGEWSIQTEDEHHWVACLPSETAVRDFMQLLFGTPAGNASGSLMDDVLQECLADLMQRLMPSTTVKTYYGQYDDKRTGIGSGALHIDIDGGLPLLGLALGGAWVEKAAAEALPAPVSPQPVSRRSAIGQGRMAVELSLGEAKLSLAELAGISVGDVLTLDSLYLNPLQLRTANGQALCKAHLGRIGQNKAIQVISR